MGSTLRIARETGAYTLTDRATWMQHADTRQLAVLFEGDVLLLNTYAVILDPSGPHAVDAESSFDWLTTGAGRHMIESYRIGGIRAFTVWPESVSGHDPRARPR